MSWIVQIISQLLKNNGTGTGSGEFDFGDFWDALQVALVAAFAIGGEAVLKHLEVLSADATGSVAFALGAVVFVLKILLNKYMDNGK